MNKGAMVQWDNGAMAGKKKGRMGKGGNGDEETKGLRD
jgi:hypothetical protein